MPTIEPDKTIVGWIVEEADRLQGHVSAGDDLAAICSARTITGYIEAFVSDLLSRKDPQP